MRALILVLVAAVTVLAPSVRTAVGDEWTDARKRFRTAQKSEDWKARAEAYTELAFFDSAELVPVLLDALGREAHGGVRYAGLKSLSVLQSAEARDAMLHALTARKGEERLFAIAGLTSAKGPEVDAALALALAGKDAPAAAQAALVLGKRRAIDALPALLDALTHKDGRVRAAAARALEVLANPPRPPTEPGKPAAAPPEAPEALRAEASIDRVLAALNKADGVARGPLSRVLARLLGQDYGLDLKAWKALRSGTPPEQIRAKPPKVPHIFGIPIYAERVAIVIDVSTRFDDAHPFRDPERLRALCEVPGGVGLPHMKLFRVKHFVREHVARLLADMPRGSKAEVLLFNEHVRSVFGGLSKTGKAMRATFMETMSELKVDANIATYDALSDALDLGGRSPAKRWKNGVQEIIFINVNQPTVGEIVEPPAIAGAIGLRGRLQMTSIHTVGILTHMRDMLARIAEETGGTYRDYEK